MVRRLERAGHVCVGYDVDAASVESLAGEVGMLGTTSLKEFVAKLDAPRHVWIMVPAAFVDATIASFTPLLESGDTIIDGGNSWYHDDIDRAKPLADEHGINYLDVGTSGGVFGLDARLLPDDRGARRCGRPAGADLRRPRPRRGGRRAHADARPARRRAVDGRARMAALRPERRRPLRQDGPQRHRVRADGGIRRGSQRAGQGEHRHRSARRRRRDGPTRRLPSTTATTSTWRRSPRCGGVGR